MAYDPILSTEVDAKSPIDVNLMTNKVKENFDDHEARILALEGGGGSGGGSSGADDPKYGSIVAGLETNEPVFWRKKYDLFETILASGEKNNGDMGFDPEGTDQTRWMGFELPYDGSMGVTFDTQLNNNTYRGDYSFIPQGASFSFKLKKGENFFGIGDFKFSSSSDGVVVTINGQSMTALGITDEMGVPRADSYSTIATDTLPSVTWFFGIDGTRENIVKIYNNDSGSNAYDFDFIEIGYRSPDAEFAVDHQLNVKAGRASVRGVQVNLDPDTLDVTPSIGYGHTAALVAGTDGSMSIFDGVEPAMTQALPEVTIPFGSGAVTSIKAKNTKFFPSTGFLLISTPWGLHTLASYTGKTETLINQHTFTGMQWQSQPTEDLTPLNAIESDTAGDSTGDLTINMWAAGGHVISASNNKLDFKVTLNGTQTTHAATIPDGLYSADIVPLGKAIADAMQAVKPLSNGSYYADYNNDSQLWTIGVRGAEVSELQLLFNTGSNAANSIHTTIGFAGVDYTGEGSYIATTAKQSLAHRVFKSGPDYISALDPRVQFNAASSPASGTEDFRTDAEERLGLGHVYRYIASQQIKIYPDHDCTGLAINYLPSKDGGMIMVQVDYGQHIYIAQPSLSWINGNKQRSTIQTAFISFPRGSRVVSVNTIDAYGMGQYVGTPTLYFVGAQQYFTKPREEALTLTQAILKCIDVAPKQFFKTPYADYYSPQATKDNVDTVTYSGSWTSSSHVQQFNGNRSVTTSSGDYVDYTFTLQGDGGGIAIMTGRFSAASKKVGYFLVSGPTGSEVSSRIQNNRLEWGAVVGNVTEDEAFEIKGLPAGQYTLRMKNEDSGQLHTSSFRIIDTIEPDRGSTVADVANAGQGVTYPINVLKMSCHQDGLDKVPAWLSGSGYREGQSVMDAQYVAATQIEDAYNDDGNVLTEQLYFGYFAPNQDNDFVRSFQFAKSICNQDGMFNGYQTQMNPVLDGRNPANKYSQQVCVKGGSCPSSFRAVYFPGYSRHVREFATGNMSNSTTFLIGNTRGFKVGATVIVSANSQPTLKRVIASITTDTNIVFTESIAGFANYTTANQAQVKCYGFHAIKNELDADGLYGLFTALCFEPMDLLPSKHDQRRMAKSKKGEIATVTFYEVQDGDDLYYPYFSDGVQASPQESMIQLISLKNTAQDVNYFLPTDLKNIQVFGSTPHLAFKITAVRRG